jgi:hypothetical protein
LLELGNWAPGHLLGHRPSRRLGVQVKSSIEIADSGRGIIFLVTGGRVRVDRRKMLALLVLAGAGEIWRLRIIRLACR